jgi:putative two-component system response regulator
MVHEPTSLDASSRSAWLERLQDAGLLRIVEVADAKVPSGPPARNDMLSWTAEQFSLAIARRDPVTASHLGRVRDLSRALAIELELESSIVCDLGYAAMLHDVGKLVIPPSILRKTGSLSAAEWDIVKQHPTWGGDVLSHWPEFRLAAEVARCHHERWDGAGYPRGLRGAEIPQAAAIVAVADAFDAMTARRPCREPVTLDEAMETILDSSGTQFSPVVVLAVLGIYSRGLLFTRRRLRATWSSRSAVAGGEAVRQ